MDSSNHQSRDVSKVLKLELGEWLSHPWLEWTQPSHMELGLAGPKVTSYSKIMAYECKPCVLIIYNG